MTDAAACPLRHRNRQLADAGVICQQHVQELNELLADIDELWSLLPYSVSHGSVEHDGSKSHGKKRADPPAPMRLDYIALTDRRAKATGRSGDIPDVPGTLTEIATDVLTQRGGAVGARATVRDSTGVLRRHRVWIAEQEWVTDLWDTLRGIRTVLARSVGVQKPAPVGKCPTKDGDGNDCGGPLWADTSGAMSVSCGRCARVFDERFLRHLGGMMAAS